MAMLKVASRGMKHWRLRDGAGHLRIEVGSLAVDDRAARERSWREMESLLWRAARDGEARRVLEPIYEELRGLPLLAFGPAAHHFERAFADELRGAALTGRLRIVREELRDEKPRGGGSGAGKAVPAPWPPKKEREVEVEPDTWIAIELVDEDGIPVPNMPYRIETPDGQVHTGLTNALGRARKDGIYAGNCKVTFPELHAPDWKKSG